MLNNRDLNINLLLDIVRQTLASGLVIEPNIPHQNYKLSLESQEQAIRRFVCADDTNVSTEQFELIGDLIKNEKYKLMWENILAGLTEYKENYLFLNKYHPYNSSDLLRIWGIDTWHILESLHKANILDQENVNLLFDAAAKSLQEPDFDPIQLIRKFYEILIMIIIDVKMNNTFTNVKYKNILLQSPVILINAKADMILDKTNLSSEEKKKLLKNPESVNAIIKLNMVDLLDNIICAAVLRAPTGKVGQLVEAFIKLKSENLLTNENNAALLENIPYAYNIASSFVLLHQQKILNDETRKLVLTCPLTATAKIFLYPFIDDLKKYINNDDADEKKSFSFTLFHDAPQLTSDDIEISAATKLIKFLEGQDNLQFNQAEIDALNNQTGLGYIISNFKNQANDMGTELELPSAAKTLQNKT